MIVELVCISAIFSGGYAVSRSLGLKGWSLAGFAVLIGISIQAIIGFILLVSRISNPHLFSVVLTFVLPILLVRFIQRKPITEIFVNRYYILPCVLIAFLVAFLHSTNLASWSVDSITYIELGNLFAQGKYELIEASRAAELPLVAAIANSPANLSGEYYLKSIPTLLGISILIIFVWLFWMGASKYLDKKSLIAFSIAGIILLLSVNRYVFNMFYINNHIFFTAGLLLVVGCGWLLLRDDENPRLDNKRLISLQSIVIPMLILSRPEAPIIVLFALIPTLFNKRLPWRLRRIPVLTATFSIIAFQGFIVYQHFIEASSLSSSVIGVFILSVVISAILIFLKQRFIDVFSGDRALVFIEAISWTIISLGLLLGSQIIEKNFIATYINVVKGAGSWGLSLILIGALALFLGLTRKSENSISLRFSITTFTPLMFSVIFLLGTAYRVGNGDSFNRSLIHILPLLVLYIIFMASVGRQREWFTKLKGILIEGRYF